MNTVLYQTKTSVMKLSKIEEKKFEIRESLEIINVLKNILED